VKKSGLPNPINPADPAVFHKPAQARSNVIHLHPTLQGQPGDGWECLIVMPCVMPKPGVNEQGALALGAGF
jgi:hypothetical protein